MLVAFFIAFTPKINAKFFCLSLFQTLDNCKNTPIHLTYSKVAVVSHVHHQLRFIKATNIGVE